jgi:hypothetical protein
LTVVTIKVSSKTLSKKTFIVTTGLKYAFNLYSKIFKKYHMTLTNFDGIELHPIFLQTLMDFDGYQPIRILFWNDEMMFTKQKHMVIKRREVCF